MDYLDLEERALYARALQSLTSQAFEKLRCADDDAGYVFIGKPPEFVPKEKPKKDAADPAMILTALLSAKEMRIVYYSLAGEVVSVMGSGISEEDLPLPEELRQEMLNSGGNPRKCFKKEGGENDLITYSFVTDSRGNRQGILKIEEIIGEGVDQFGWDSESGDRNLESAGTTPERDIDASQNIAELFSLYPAFKEDFFLLDEELAGLKGPFGMEILKESTVGMLAKSLRLDTDDLVRRINEIIRLL